MITKKRMKKYLLPLVKKETNHYYHTCIVSSNYQEKQSYKQQIYAKQQLHETHFTKEVNYFYNNKNDVIYHVKSRKSDDDDDLFEHGQKIIEKEKDFFVWKKLKNWLWRNVFIHLVPNKYPQSVKSNYITFCKWQSIQYIASSMGGVLSMQSMLYAVGVGSGSVPLAAALNWVIKDGLGQLGGVLFASKISTNFDSDPKKWRVRAEVFLMASTMLEISTPLFPSGFLPLAAIANIGKNISCLASSATRAAINNSFVNMDNLADITGKSGSQAIASSLIGTGLAILVSPFVGSNLCIVFPAFCLLSFIQMFALYRALKCVVLDNFNLQRAEIVIQEFLSNGIILDKKQVSMKERFILPYKSILPGQLIINPLLQDFCNKNENRIEYIEYLRQLFKNDKYLIHVSDNRCVKILYLKEATTDDVFKGIVHTSLIRLKLGTNSSIDDNLILETKQENEEKMNILHVALIDKGWNLTHDFIEERPNRIEFY